MVLLAVDDEQLALYSLMRTLKQAVPDARAVGFTEPEEALEYAGQHQVDVAFLDVEMGAMSGLMRAKRLKDLRGTTNIIFVTAHMEYAFDACSLYCSGYLLKPVTKPDIEEAMANLRHPIQPKEGRRLRIQAFGNFEVFVDGTPLHFPRAKAKELFAYLIHRRGASCTTRELAAVLFEERPYTLTIQRQLQTNLHTMIQTLKRAGVEECIIRRYNQTSVDVSKFDCDYYRFLEGDMAAVNQYAGEYMANYSWAEFVIGYLDHQLS